MAAVNQLRDVTWAGPYGPGSPRVPRDDESYAAASPGIPSRLIFPGPRMQVRTQIFAKHRRYQLRDMFIIDLAYLEDDAEVFASHRLLPVHGYGSDLHQALAAFCEAFDFQWRNLVEVPEETLTEGGKRRRQAMEAAVQDVAEVELLPRVY